MKTQRRWIAVAGFGMCLSALVGWALGPTLPLGAAENEEPVQTFQPGTTLVPWYSGWVRTRGMNEASFTAKTKQTPYEAVFDTRTGNVIYFAPESGALAATPSHMNREFRCARIGNTFEALRFDPRNGTAWRLRGDQWTPVSDPQPLASGLYDVQLMATSDTTFLALRSEGISGQSWTLITGPSGDTWRLIPDAGVKPAAAPAP